MVAASSCAGSEKNLNCFLTFVHTNKIPQFQKMIFAPPNPIPKIIFLKWFYGNFYRQQLHFYSSKGRRGARIFRASL